jgi:hypothetical protein
VIALAHPYILTPHLSFTPYLLPYVWKKEKRDEKRERKKEKENRKRCQDLEVWPFLPP